VDIRQPDQYVRLIFDGLRVAQLVVESAIVNSLIYGLPTLGMALLTGWIASIVFRRL
jgi:hypothetical protein